MTDYKDLTDEERAALPKGERMYMEHMIGGEQERLGEEIKILVGKGCTPAHAHDLLLNMGLSKALLALEDELKEHPLIVLEAGDIEDMEGEHICQDKYVEDVHGVPLTTLVCYLSKGHRGLHRGWSSKGGEKAWD